MPNATIIRLPLSKCIDRAAAELRAETEAVRNIIAEQVTSYHLGRCITDDETAHLWAAADLLDDLSDCTDEQRRAVADVLRGEVVKRIGREW